MTDLTEDIVATMRHPVLVLDEDFRVVLANPAFCTTFEPFSEQVAGCSLWELGNGRWDIPELRRLLREDLNVRNEITDVRVEIDFERVGHRAMVINAWRVRRNSGHVLLLEIEDVGAFEDAFWELEAQKEYAEKIIDASRYALLILDRNLRVKSANEVFYKTFKVDRQETEGRLVYELGNGQWDIPRLRELLEDVLPENNSFDDFEVEHNFENIGHREMILNARKIDRRQWILLVIEDVSERKRHLEELRTSEERFRMIVENARDYAIFTTDREGCITGWYAGAQNVFGWRAEEVVGRHAALLFTPEDRERGEVAGELRTAAREGAAQDVRWHLNRDGRVVFIEGKVFAMRDAQGTLNGFFKIGQDVTERRNAEQRLRTALETETVGVIFFNDAKHLIGTNDAFLTMTGYSRSDVESGEMSWRDITPPDRIEMVEGQWKKLRETGRLGPYEKDILHKDGSRSWMLFSGRDLGDGTTVEYCFDISDRKEAEEQRELLLAELSHRVKNILAVVQGLAAQTLTRSKSLEEFGTAFRGRLAAIARGHALLLRGDWKPTGLEHLVGEAVSAFDPDRVRARGPIVYVSPRVALSLNLVLHELETNSAKYGALSSKEGRVNIGWTREEEGKVQMVWRERGGPPVIPPEHQGFGTKLIKQLLRYELDGDATLKFKPDGLKAELTFSTFSTV